MSTPKWITVFAVAGFLGAAIFYSPYWGETPLACPLCGDVTIVGVSVLARFFRLPIVFGIINAVTFILVGTFVVKIARGVTELIEEKGKLR